MIIAVDGPAASGKGTIARALARHYGLPHLDTGLLYRAVAMTVQRLELDGSKEADAVAACDFDDSLLADPGLRSDAIGQLASVVSAHPLVRASLFQRQRRFANQPGGAVLDGRDIGTIIAPDASVKLFVIASVAARAERRFLEMQAQGRDVSLDSIAADLKARDLRDTQRLDAPLVAASDAVVLDTSDLGREEAIGAAVVIAEQAFNSR